VRIEEDLSPYQPPYWDLVPRATIEQMKEVVCVQECRPSIPAIWNDYEVRETAKPSMPRYL